MNANPEILSLLDAILNRECDRSSLARWLAQNSLHFLESPNEQDRMIVADLDAALGEIQRGVHNAEFLVETATQLVKGLRLTLPGREVIIYLAGSSLEIGTASTNVGGTPMAAVEVEPVPSPA